MINTKPCSFAQDSITYLAPSWSDLNQLAFETCERIKQQDKKFDRVVALAKGGWPMTRSIVDFLGIDEVASIGIKFYAGINERYQKPQIYQDLPVSVTGENILLFDDVADSGGSLIFTTDYLLKQGAKTVVTACLYYKPHSQLKPDFYGAKTSAWIIFPFEQFEAMKILAKNWTEQKVSQSEIIQRFKKLNFSDQFIQSALKL